MSIEGLENMIAEARTKRLAEIEAHGEGQNAVVRYLDGYLQALNDVLALTIADLPATKERERCNCSCHKINVMVANAPAIVDKTGEDKT